MPSQYGPPEHFDNSLRLGDIITGFSYVIPNFDDFINSGNAFTLDITPQDFFAVLTPCCSIEEKIISVVPLNKVDYTFFKNPYFATDFTNINRPVPPEKTVPPEIWEKFPDQKKTDLLAKGDTYTFWELFFYEPHHTLPQYQISRRNSTPLDCAFYVIDFKKTFTIVSKKIQRGASYPKVLQLTVKSRGELRNKLASFYSRIPDEDL